MLTIAQRALGLGSLAKIFDADDPNLIGHTGKNMYKLYRSTNTSFYLHRHDGDNFCQPPKSHAGPLVFFTNPHGAIISCIRILRARLELTEVIDVHL